MIHLKTDNTCDLGFFEGENVVRNQLAIADAKYNRAS